MIEIKNLQLDFVAEGRTLRALDGVSLSIAEGETVCLVGESGSGKSLTALSIARLVPTPPAVYNGGEILVQGRDVLRMKKAELREIRGRVVSYIFQEPSASLNPLFRVSTQIKEMLHLHRRQAATDAEVIRLLKLVGISAPELRARAYPHQLSGGMQQRVMIAMAIAARPKLLVADEPTTALDVTIQSQILDLLRQLKSTLGMSMLLITHNLAIIKDIADKVAVMYAGQIVEMGPAAEVIRNPLHPYTRALINSVPRIGAHEERLQAIGGNVPQLGAWPPGCRFHPRCPTVRDYCKTEMPELRPVGNGRFVRCPYVS
jgi:oligopeptide/dipeptide ABC transporter ATP-binding protein